MNYENVIYQYKFQHIILPRMFFGHSKALAKTFKEPEIVLVNLIGNGYILLNNEDPVEYNEKNSKFFDDIMSYIRLNFGKKFVIDVNEYQSMTIDSLKFLDLGVWTSPACERICFVWNEEYSKFAFYTVELGPRNQNISPFGNISVESNKMGDFMLCEHSKDGIHNNYGRAPIGEKNILMKLRELFGKS